MEVVGTFVGNSDVMFDGEFDGDLFDGKLGGNARIVVRHEERPFALFFFLKKREKSQVFSEGFWGGSSRGSLGTFFDGEVGR